MRQVISAAGGVEQILHVDNVDGTMGAIELRQDVENVLREVRRKREAGADSRSGELRAMAEIPMAEYLKAVALGAQDDRAYWARWLKENPAFRIHGGHV